MLYQPVVTRQTPLVRATALVGIHSVLLGFDFLGKASERKKLLGFAIHRADLSENEAWWLSGQIRFRNLEGDFGEDVPSNRAPFQKFHWGDYTAKPGRHYVYSIHPVLGRPGNLSLREPAILDLVTAENSPGLDGVYFNRGVTAALAYRRRFGDVAPEKVPHSAAYRWLSRGLEEALLGFIAAAVAGDELKVAIYEFEHRDVITALEGAIQRGVSIRLLYHAKAGDKQATENLAHVQLLGLPASRVVARRNVPNISHNKFIAHRKSGAAAAHRVWTGSTNFTTSGLFLQTNVGLVLEQPLVARAFEEYFELLWRDFPGAEMKAPTAALATAVRAQLPMGPRLFFSPVAGSDLLDAAVDITSRAQDAVFISSPFGLDKRIVTALNGNDKRVLEYGLVNTTNRNKLLSVIDRSLNAWYASPAWVKEYDGRLWDARAYGNHKIHVKSIVTDPWGQNPRVLIGSANFSDESVNRNDENALLIQGDSRMAAIVTTEFLRMFDHYKFRDYLARAKKETGERFLAEDGSWTKDYFDPAKFKFRDRIVFAARTAVQEP